MIVKDSLQKRNPWMCTMVATTSTESKSKALCVDIAVQQTGDQNTKGNQFSDRIVMKCKEALENAVNPGQRGEKLFDNETEATYDVMRSAMQNHYCSI